MFDFIIGILEIMAKIISVIWDVLVLPYKLIWIILVIGILAKFYFKKSRIN